MSNISEEKDKIVTVNGRNYNLDKLTDEEILKLHEYVVKKGNSLLKKIENLM